ncbi:hypothetical protein [Rubrivirga sp. IMCC45206]|uniref:hypothetical protein n=1 Tax=Rubrivirga sp. IMCC45206 TaxID=3391614 RepID=UPI00398F9596
MPQTLLALFALVLASFLTFNQQRLTLRAQTNMVTSEVELAGAGVASEVMALVESMSFDENSTPDAIYAAQEVPSESNEFKSSSAFGATDRGDAGCNLMDVRSTPDCDDVDDIHGLGWQPYTIRLADEIDRDPVTGDPIAGGARRLRELAFEYRATVYYVVNPQSMAPASGRTLHKRIVLDVRSPYIDNDDEGRVRLTRVISYDPIKAEMDYENTDGYGPIGNESSGSGSGTVNM